MFVIFDSHPRPDKHPHGAAFIFKNSASGAARHVADLLRYDERLLHDSTVQWQAQLLAHCSGDIFVARDSHMKNQHWAELALDASIQVLSLQGRVRELESNNENLQEDSRRLTDEVSDLEDKLLELDSELERLKAENAKLRKAASVISSSSATKSLQHSSQSPLGTVTAPSSAQSSRPPQQNGRSVTSERAPHIDPLALQLQYEYDRENRRLEQERRSLQLTQPTLFDCGICFERFQEDFAARIMPCMHQFCRSCVKEYAVSVINEHRYPIMCPLCKADKNNVQPSGACSSLYHSTESSS